ncbi:hypothetical protein FISHEDRAFT_36921 [Fistulina hepatica ATCC 64428]|uniref:UDENN domain-containing protein n=1 Tax=Fistulina hepatica ATCC 64428 TaxID=1128425 RepID=A0A0D7AII9_9AGAR|nr:hypothetical protein FISHEDRAFT_36921 [Fistulina hepatica ATCC 64428]
MIIPQFDGPLVLGIALVDFNHLVGPRIEHSLGDIFEDEEVAKILPFLALPDGAHLASEDYCYFHVVPSGPRPRTIFGISCNQQIAASTLLAKMPDVTRSTVQKAVVVLASKPAFGPIRDKLGVVTTALFNQHDFRDLSILEEFSKSLEPSLRSQMTESGLFIGTNLRELVHLFRHQTLVLVKALMLQKRIIFTGQPVEDLCTFQYSLVSLFPELMHTLDDCGSPPLAERAKTLLRPSSLKTSSRKSMRAYLGLPLDIFGKDAFFQPYLPLQQLDIAKDTNSYLCGTTNSIVTQQPEIDLVVDITKATLEMRDPRLKRCAELTATDRKWIDEIVHVVDKDWIEETPEHRSTFQFEGSDDYLRQKFEDYISAALACLRYQDFVKGDGSSIITSGGTGSPNPWQGEWGALFVFGDIKQLLDFNPLWLAEFRATNAYEVWERTTDPMLFDIIEPKHPCDGKVSAVEDLGLRISEGLQQLKLEQQLAPAREAVARTITTGSTSFLKVVEGVRERWNAPRSPTASASVPGTPTGNSDSSIAAAEITSPSASRTVRLSRQSTSTTSSDSSTGPAASTISPRASFSSWSSNISSFLTTRTPRFSLSKSAPVRPEFVPRDVTPEHPPDFSCVTPPMNGSASVRSIASSTSTSPAPSCPPVGTSSSAPATVPAVPDTSAPVPTSTPLPLRTTPLSDDNDTPTPTRKDTTLSLVTEVDESERIHDSEYAQNPDPLGMAL